MEEKVQHKSVPQKSPNYPNISLDAALEKVKTLYEKDGKAGAPRKVALGYWGYSSESGPAVRTISALKKFGLTEDKQGRIVPTQRALDLLVYPKDSERYGVALKDAALSPKTYKDLWEKYRTGFPSDESLKAELISEENFNPKQVDGFLADFRSTLAFACLTPGTGHEEEMPEQPPRINQPGQPGNLRTPPSPPARLANAFPIPLKNQNQAVISFQRMPLDKADLDLLKKWIDLMADNLMEQAGEQSS